MSKHILVCLPISAEQRTRIEAVQGFAYRFTTPDTEEAMLKAVAIERSFVTYVLCDHTKFGKVSAVSFSPVAAACIVCDKCDDEQLKSKTVVKEVTA